MAPRYEASEDEYDRMDTLVDSFWKDFSRLVASTLDSLDIPALEDELLMRMEDRASVHGSAFDRYRKGT